MIQLQVNHQYFKKINSGVISHIIVCKEEGVKQGDILTIRDNQSNDCKLRVNYVDCEGSGIDEDYCIVNVKKI